MCLVGLNQPTRFQRYVFPSLFPPNLRIKFTFPLMKIAAPRFRSQRTALIIHNTYILHHYPALTLNTWYDGLDNTVHCTVWRLIKLATRQLHKCRRLREGVLIPISSHSLVAIDIPIFPFLNYAFPFLWDSHGSMGNGSSRERCIRLISAFYCTLHWYEYDTQEPTASEMSTEMTGINGKRSSLGSVDDDVDDTMIACRRISSANSHKTTVRI